ncbi:hypothetical protein [Cryobacterium tepidiphilum]|nr:hypothetical protein [Cryobacterium tepidiphilum]
MAALTASIPPAVAQDRASHRDDLAADLRALADRRGDVDAFMILSRPSILRRLARMIAETLPVGIDRLVGSHGQDDALVSAVALHTGIPFAVVDTASGAVHGELHVSEKVAIVRTRRAAGEGTLEQRLEELGAHVVTSVSVLAAESTASAGDRALFGAADIAGPVVPGRAA